MQIQHNKYKKSHRIIRKINTKFTKDRLKKPLKHFHYGTFGLIAITSGTLTNAQYDVIKLLMNKKLKKTYKFWFKIKPNQPISKKPIETRMGKGKGATAYWITRINKGQLLIEFDTIPKSVLLKLTNQIQHKLQIKCKLITNRQI